MSSSHAQLADNLTGIPNISVNHITASGDISSSNDVLADKFISNGYTKEEMKMVEETRKILGDGSIGISPTTVRVPVLYSHSESLNVETERPISVANVKDLLSEMDGVRIVDNPKNNEYPLAIDAEGKDDVFVGRIRDDISCENAINFWVVSDNLRKGAALNAIQIAEYLTIRSESNK